MNEKFSKLLNLWDKCTSNKFNYIRFIFELPSETKDVGTKGFVSLRKKYKCVVDKKKMTTAIDKEK